MQDRADERPRIPAPAVIPNLVQDPDRRPAIGYRDRFVAGCRIKFSMGEKKGAEGVLPAKETENARQ